MNKRSRKIIRVSILGVIVNFALAGFKLVVGLLSNSIAIILDAVNNFSDSLSSIVTIVGMAFANKAPDKKHPMGHGRAEYLSTIIIGMLILYIGLTALIESIKKIINPVDVDYRTETVIVVSVAIAVKIALGLYVHFRGKKLKSGSLIGSGIDAIYDAVISAATLVAIIVFFVSGHQVEAYLAAGISVFIIRSGVKLIRSAFSMILGERADPALTKRIKADIAKIDGVNGAFDLAMHDYGNGIAVASVNIEVDDRMKASEIDQLSRTIQEAIYKKHHIVMSSVGIYAIDLNDKAVEKLWQKVNDVRGNYKHIIEIHGFRVDSKSRIVYLDVVVDFVVQHRRAYYSKFCRELQDNISGYSISAVLDSDISD